MYAGSESNGGNGVTLTGVKYDYEQNGWKNKIYNIVGGKDEKASRGDHANPAFSSDGSSSSSGSSVGIDKEVIAILGSGDFGRALASRFVQSGYAVNIGSRDPTRNAPLVESVGAQLLRTEEAIRSSRIVVVAVPRDYYPDLPLQMLRDKIVIDCSNRSTISRKTVISQAEFLQNLIPDAHVVKAFNVLSAYALETGGIQGSKEVYVAGDNSQAKDEVIRLIRGAGFTPVDKGSLRAAREIEDIPVQRFTKWKVPLIISVAIFIFIYLITFAKIQFCWTITWGDGTWHWKYWKHIPMDNMNKVLAVHALTLLAACYLPGVIAAYVQLIRGTKYSRFPKWLDNWLKMRKQLGLLMLFSASVHACLSVAILSPTYHDLAYGYPRKIQADVITGNAGNWTHPNLTISEDQEVEIFGEEKMHWRGECFLICGVMSFALAMILGITSLPSVTAQMTWKEFAFIQSKLGWICMLFACAHDMFFGWPYMNGPSCYIPSSFQYALYLPGLAIVLKFPLLFPCVDSHLQKIRGGWERRSRIKATKIDVQSA